MLDWEMSVVRACWLHLHRFMRSCAAVCVKSVEVGAIESEGRTISVSAESLELGLPWRNSCFNAG